MKKGFAALDNASISKCPIGEETHINGEFSYENNGFYFSYRPEIALRLSPSKNVDSLMIVKPEGSIICGDDFFENRELGIEGIYACDTITLEEPLGRDLLISMVLNSNDISRAGVLISYVKLTPQERVDFIKAYGDKIIPYIEYFQDGNLNAFYEYYDRIDEAFKLEYCIKKRG